MGRISFHNMYVLSIFLVTCLIIYFVTDISVINLSLSLECKLTSKEYFIKPIMVPIAEQ